jgi:acetoin utilization protein AcuC
MTGAVAFLYHDDFMLYQFGPRHPFQPIREKLTMDTLSSLGALEGCDGKVVVPEPVGRERLHRVHPPEFVNEVERICMTKGELDQGDTPGNPGLFTGALAAVGASVRGVQGIMGGEFAHAFNPAGGLHHAHPTRASGFCVFNDIAVAVRCLQVEHGIQRVAVVDIDGHHGDGTQAIFFNEGVLTISLHRYGRGFFPGSGGIEERGEGEGRGLNINIPLPGGTDDKLYLRAYRSVAVPALRLFKPQFIIHQFGVDGHFQDPLVGLGLSTRGYSALASITHDLAHQLCDGRYLVVGGGGYDIDATRRAWALMFAALTGRNTENDDRLAALHDPSVPTSGAEVAVEVDRVVGRQIEVSLPMVEKVIRYA